MNQNEEQLAALNDIRKMMERSSKFISLNGFSGVFIGIFALLGVATMAWFLHTNGSCYRELFSDTLTGNSALNIQVFAIISVAVLILSLLISSWLTIRKAKKNGLKIWDKTTRIMLLNLMIPLVTGGVFCLILLYHQLTGLIAPSMLIFYGLALINASKYTYPEVRILGILEIITGLLASVFIPFGLIFWAFGFGILHIIYGWIMYYRYERQPSVK
ncbi:MAG: hypothetical protein CVU05_05980 [Bacteroidetes bacterium HGW-Bacteroidetes-21]|nr:MAG: hypothetical protein CVU05_05980 [Bacteroidetes bacterium HGW-Bacteroidetes-21]